MDNIKELISTGDFFLLFFYAILFYFILRAFVFKRMDGNFKRLFTVFFILKVFCALLMCLLTVYYWGFSDNTAFFSESKNLVHIIKSDISNIKYFFQPVESYNEKIELDNELSATVSSIGIESNFLIAKLSAILYPFAFGRYLILNFFFSMIATVGQFTFFLALTRRYPHIKKNIAVAVLLMPSMVLYSSYMNKETLCVAFMGFAFYNFFQIANKRKRVINALLLLINIYFVGTLKIYVLVSFFIAVLLVYFIKMVMQLVRGSIFLRIGITGLLIILFWLFLSNLSYFDSYIIDAVKTSNSFQENYNSMDETSSFEFGEIETSFAGLLKKAPLGIYTTYFRPHLWEVNKPIILFSAFESAITLLITFSALIFRRKNILPLLKNDLFASISFYFALIFGMIVGLTTFNFGSLVRYKVPAVPFLMMFVFLLLHYHANKNVPLKK